MYNAICIFFHFIHIVDPSDATATFHANLVFVAIFARIFLKEKVINVTEIVVELQVTWFVHFIVL